MSLTEHGILQDESLYRAHVGFIVKAVYLFPTVYGKKAVRSGKFKTVQAFQPGVNSPTSEGIIPPWNAIYGCVEIPMPPCVAEGISCHHSESPSAKGQKALFVVIAMMQGGFFPIKIHMVEVTDAATQIKGIDLAGEGITIQVKCDFACGSKSRGGTGNLYLEVKETNPFGYT